MNQEDQKNQDYMNSMSNFTKKPGKRTTTNKFMIWISVIVIITLTTVITFQQGWIRIERIPSQELAQEEVLPPVSSIKQLPPSENDAIELLRGEIDIAFYEQVMAFFESGETDPEKVDRYEALMEDLGRELVNHYVHQGHGTMEDAKEAMRQYVLNFSVDFDGMPIGLSPDSADFYADTVVK
jgi:hypothetical protein